VKIFLGVIGFTLLAPIIGGIISGLDRILTARVQGRVGPPLLQPFYDVFKLFEKESIVVRRSQNFYVFFFLLFIVFTGCLFFSGGDLLLVIFALTLADVFLVLGAYRTSSPFSQIGAERELIQMMAFEPMIIIMAIGMYMVTGSFNVGEIASSSRSLALALPGILFGLIYVLTIKLRKSPFDLSTSHHAHQEIVKGVTVEFSGSGLAMIEIAHFYEKVIVLGFVYLFFANNFLLAMAALAVIYLLEIFIDNTFARFKWQLVVKSTWLVAAVFGMGNIAALYFAK
jgi:ech hydrogenase subunit B